ncbi:MAG: hypothetical protein JNJ59_13610, partial [Deltaproteobacteria bacterium]|nr:hypothetical protein [Deltaproteobacteria bacterium]
MKFALGLALVVGLGGGAGSWSACDDADTASDVKVPAPIVVIVPQVATGTSASEVEARDDAVAVLVRDLTAMGHPPKVITAASQGEIDAVAELRPGLVLVIDADQLGAVDPIASDASVLPDPRFDDRFALIATKTDGAANALDGAPAICRVDLFARTRLGRFYSVYEVLRRLGARYFHPEDSFLPVVPATEVLARVTQPTVLGPGPVYAPDFGHRSWTFHGAHPLEHLEAFSDARHPIDEAVRVNDWIIANRGDLSRGAGRGVAPDEAATQRQAELEALRIRRGLRKSAGITLHNQQQGASADIDPTSAVPIADQIIAAVARAVTGVPDAYAFGIHFGPTELTTTPDRETIDWLDKAGKAALDRGLPVEVNDHTSGSQPVDHYDDLGCPPGTNDRGVADYYDLAFHTDPRMGVRVHTVMFYPLEGPANVYGQKSFAHKLCLMQKASAAKRPLVYFPESAYWLSWDNAIPVYLPLYLWARGRDMQLIQPLLAKNGGTLRDHRLFNSGQEWGYWQADYAVGLWHWKSDLTMDDVLGELADPLCRASEFRGCDARTTYIAVLKDVMERQRQAFLEAVDFRGRPGGLYVYFAGEDPADEIGARSGLEFRPVRIPFRDLAGMFESERQAFEGRDLAWLDQLALDFQAQHDRLARVRGNVPADALRFLDEVLDGLEIDALRAQHTAALYRVALALSDHAPESPEVAAPLVAAREALAAARVVIARREASYRYPAAQMYGGGLTAETAVPNGTTYPFRVHTKTHLLSYWTHRQEQVEDLVAGKTPRTDALLLSPVFADPSAPVAVTWPGFDGLSGSLDRGDGATLSVDTPQFSYASPGIYRVGGTLQAAGEPIDYSGALVRTRARAKVASGAFELVEPEAELARTVLKSLLPPLQIALEGSRVALLPEPSGFIGEAPFSEVTVAELTEENSGFASQPVAFALPIPDPSTGLVSVRVRVSDAVLSGTSRDLSALAASGGVLTLSGALSVSDLVSALVELAGFERVGATTTLAGILGFDPSDPPETVPFRASLTLSPPSNGGL